TRGQTRGSAWLCVPWPGGQHLMKERRVATDDQLGTETARFLGASLDRIEQGVTVFDRELRLIYANRSLGSLIDIPAHLLQPGTTFEQIINHNAQTGEYGDGNLTAMVEKRVELARRFEEHSIERTRPNGMVLRISGWPLPGGGFASIYTDVTEEKRREARLQREVADRTRELRQNEARLRLIANEVPAGIAYLDRDQVFRFANTRFASAYGLTPEMIDGRPAPTVLSPELMALSRPYFERAGIGENIQFDHDLALPDGRQLEVRTFLRPEREQAVSSAGFYVLSIYIGRQKRADAALLQTKKMAALDQLSSGIAHDFNNLLTIIIGNLDPLAAHVTDGAVRSTMLEPALRAAQRGAELTQRLLATARREPVAPQPTDVADVMATLYSLTSRSLPKEITVALTIAPQAPHCFVDRAHLENALLNLVLNARDAISGAGTISLQVAAVALHGEAADRLDLPPGEYVEIVCADDGGGMSADVQDRIFEPFFSTKGEHGGSGLGLAMVYGFVRESGGAITVSSAVGHGTRFRIVLPAHLADPALQQDALSANRAHAPAATQGPDQHRQNQFEGTVVLLVDDDHDVRAVVRRMLVRHSFSVIEACDGQEALDLAVALPDVALVLSDIAMPGALSGDALAKALQTARPEVAVLLMTGHGLETFASPAAELGARILRKPLDEPTLIAAVSKALGA
ncbi:MAG: PAS-domain containing protein, partial [Pseudomonadota bacterium]